MSIYHEIIEALNPLLNAFDQIGIFYYIGGSVSSSLHGIHRRTHERWSAGRDGLSVSSIPL